MGAQFRKFIESTPLLLVVFSAGLIPIIFVRFVLPGVFGAFISATIAVVAIAWLWFHYRTQDPAYDRQLAGDNLYYLGLLFTLASLIIALIRLFLLEGYVDGGSSIQERAYDLIGGFGIALVSTVAGILGRIVLQSEDAGGPVLPAGALPQPRDSVPESADSYQLNFQPEDSVDAMKVRRALVEDAQQLRLVLRQATDAFSHFTRITGWQAENTRTHTKALMRSFNDEMATSASDGLESAATSWRGAAEVIRTDAKQLEQQFNGITEQFSTRMSQVVEQIAVLTVECNKQVSEAAQQSIRSAADAWTQMAESMRSDNQRLSESLNQQVTVMTSAADSIRRDLTEFSGVVSTITRQLNAESKELGPLAEHTAAAGRNVENLARALDSAGENLKAVVELSANATGKLQDSAATLASAQETLQQRTAQRLEESIGEYRSVITDFVDSARKDLKTDADGWISAAKQLTDEGRTQQQDGVRTIEAARQWGEQMSEEVKQWTTLAERTRNSLVHVVEQLTDVVRKS